MNLVEQLRKHAAADEIEKFRGTAEYWKAEHLAGNAEIERLRNALSAIWDKYLTGGSQHEPTTSLAGTLAYMAKDALTTPNAALTGAAKETEKSPDANPRPV